MDLVALILPVLGWITGAWERSFASRGDPAKIEHGIKVIGAAMMTTIGIMTAATFYTLIASQDSLHVPSRAAYSALVPSSFGGVSLCWMGARGCASK